MNWGSQIVVFRILRINLQVWDLYLTVTIFAKNYIRKMCKITHKMTLSRANFGSTMYNGMFSIFQWRHIKCHCRKWKAFSVERTWPKTERSTIWECNFRCISIFKYKIWVYNIKRLQDSTFGLTGERSFIEHITPLSILW